MSTTLAIVRALLVLLAERRVAFEVDLARDLGVPRAVAAASLEALLMRSVCVAAPAHPTLGLAWTLRGALPDALHAADQLGIVDSALIDVALSPHLPGALNRDWLMSQAA